jgi:hypothetical protein
MVAACRVASSFEATCRPDRGSDRDPQQACHPRPGLKMTAARSALPLRHDCGQCSPELQASRYGGRTGLRICRDLESSPTTLPGRLLEQRRRSTRTRATCSIIGDHARTISVNASDSPVRSRSTNRASVDWSSPRARPRGWRLASAPDIPSPPSSLLPGSLAAAGARRRACAAAGRAA